jgi:cytochrome P450
VDPAYVAVESSVILIGGVLTPAHMMASAMMLLVQHPDQLAEVVADHSLIPRALEESLRLEAPDQFMPRYVTTDTRLGGAEIPAGSLVLLLYASANRDDATFADAERFDVHRENAKQHLAFGKGIHFCLGAPLARMMGRHAFETVLTRMADMRLAPGAGEPEPLESIFNRAPRALPLIFAPA